jgi:hypothetical protein
MKNIKKSPKINKPRKYKTTKTARKTKTMRPRKTMKLTSQKPTVLYSKNNKTGEETVASFTTKNNNGMKGYAMAVESQIPPTVYKSSNGSTVMTMSQKRSLVVQNYKDMNHNRFKITKPSSA